MKMRRQQKMSQDTDITSGNATIDTDLLSLAPTEKYLNISALETHGIIYTHVPEATKVFTKLKLPGIPRKEQNKSTESGKKIIGDGTKVRRKNSKKSSKQSKEQTAEHPKNMEQEDNALPPDNPLQDSESKCADFLTSRKSLTFMAKKEVLTQSDRCSAKQNHQYFESNIPKEFEAFCVAALRSFVVRKETVMTSRGFKRIDSMTINRYPLCTYGRDKSNSVTN
uniref:Uncharacterized protein n=1 Tax=Ciona savignyi TaxID=51511 RepID=H2ZQC9_CIOSA